MPKAALRIPVVVLGESMFLDVQAQPGDKAKCTLYISDLPRNGVAEADLQSLFSNFGQVEAVAVSEEDETACVVFATPKGLKTTLSQAKKGFTQPFTIEASPVEEEEDDEEEEEFKPPQGLKKWLGDYKAQRPGNEILKKRVDMWITNWEKEQESEKASMLAQAEEDDGWTLVTSKKGKNKNVSATGTVAYSVSKGKATAIGAKEAMKAKVQLDDFYRFQKREQNRNGLLKLREKFDEDKRKVAKLKAARKFKPY